MEKRELLIDSAKARARAEELASRLKIRDTKIHENGEEMRTIIRKSEEAANEHALELKRMRTSQHRDQVGVASPSFNRDENNDVASSCLQKEISIIQDALEKLQRENSQLGQDVISAEQVQQLVSQRYTESMTSVEKLKAELDLYKHHWTKLNIPLKVFVSTGVGTSEMDVERIRELESAIPPLVWSDRLKRLVSAPLVRVLDARILAL